jgi:hypothetical protein
VKPDFWFRSRPGEQPNQEDFVDRQKRRSLTLNKSWWELMSAIAAKFDLALQPITYRNGPARAFGIASLADTLLRIINATNFSITFRII